MYRAAIFCVALSAAPVAAADPVSPTVPELVKRLESGSPGERVIAAEMLADLGPGAAEAIPALARVVDTTRPINEAYRYRPWTVRWPNPSPGTRWLFAAALEALDRIGPKAVPAKIALLDHRRPEARVEIAISLQRDGPAAADAVPALIKMLEQKEPYVSYTAAMTLAKIGSRAKAAIPALAARYLETTVGEPANQEFDDDYYPPYSQSPYITALAALGPKGEAVIRDKMVPRLVAQIAEGKSRVYYAANELLFLKEKAAPAVPAIVDLVRKRKADPDFFSESVARVLLSAGPEGRRAFAKLLGDKDDQLRSRMFRLLEGPPPSFDVKPLVPTLLASLEDRIFRHRILAAGALARLGDQASDEVIQAVFELFQDAALHKNEGGESNLFELAMTVSRFGKAALPALEKMLGSKNPFDVMVASIALGRMGGIAAETVPALRIATRHRFLAPSLEAAEAVVRITHAERDLAVLLINLRHEEASVRSTVLARLYEFGPILGEFEDELVFLLQQDRNAEVREQAFQLIVALPRPKAESLAAAAKAFPFRRSRTVPHTAPLGAGFQPAVPALIKIIERKHDEFYLRNAACRMLAGIGPAAKDAVPVLIPLLKEKDLAFAAMSALAAIGPAAGEAVPALARFLDDPSEEMYFRQALYCLGDIGPAAKEVVPIVEKFRSDPDPETRIGAVYALLRIRGNSAELRTELGRALRSEMRRGEIALQAFNRLPAEYPDLVPDVLRAVPRVLPYLRSSAAKALARYGPAARPIVPHILKWLEEPDEFAQPELLTALAAIGPAAKDALPKLRELANHSNIAVAAAARRGIRAIENK